MRITLALLLALFVSSAAFAQQSIGRKADPFNGYTLDGKEIRSEDFDGKIVVLTFWSTKCVICYNEIPQLNKVADNYLQRNVVFLAPTLSAEAALPSFLKKRPFKFTVVPNSLGMLLQYADRDNRGRPIMSYPAYFVIDRGGRVAYKTEGGGKVDNLENQLRKLAVE